MPPAKRRRVASVKKPTSCAAAPRSLFPFAKITKAKEFSASDTKKRDFVAEADSTNIVSKSITSQSKKTHGSKRNPAEAEVDEAEDVGTSPLVSAGKITTQNDPESTNGCIDHFHFGQPSEATQSNLRPLLSAVSGLPARADRPRNIAPSISGLHHAQTSLRLSDSRESTSRDEHGQLPEALQDLIKLHSSFLTALSLHHAHNRNLAPVDLRLLAPSIGLAWGRRRVTVDDIRRTLGVLEIKPSVHNVSPLGCPEHGLKLSDYGNGKICVEMSDYPKQNLSLDTYIDVEVLKTQFARNLYGYWNSRGSAMDVVSMTEIQEAGTVKNDADTEVTLSHWKVTSAESVAKFIQSLPMATINICPSHGKASSLLAKGQRRLEEFKCIAPPTKRGECDEVQAESSLAGDHNAVIRAKKLYKSNLSPPLSKAAADRKSALQRLDEVISVIAHLSASGAGLPRTERGKGSTVGELQATIDCSSNLSDLSSIADKQKVSLPLATLVLHLKNSLTNPISREEAGKCIQLLADEVAPDWVDVVTLGEVAAVIINRRAGIGVSGWKGRVEM